MFNSIWKKFMIALLVVAFVPILYFGYQDLQAKELSVTDETLRHIFLNSVTRSTEIERAFINAHMDINYLRSSIAIEFMLSVYSEERNSATYWKSLVEKEFSRFLSLKPGYSSVGFVNDYGDEEVVVIRNGKEIISLENNKKVNRLTAPYYVEAAQLEGFGIAAIPMQSFVHPALNFRNFTLIRYAAKVFDKAGKPRGVIYIDLNGVEILDGLTRTSLERRRKAALLTYEGNYIFNPFAKPASDIPSKQSYKNIKLEFPDKVTAQILSGRSGIIADDPHYLFAYSAVYPQASESGRYYVVLDRIARHQLAPRLDGIKKQYFLGAAGTLLLALIVAVIVSRTLTRQIKKLREGVERFGRHELNHRIDIRSKDEIESLANAYNMMADSLKEYSESLEKKVEERSIRIKQVERKLMQSEKLAAIGFLSAGVAHEINNPISIIVSRLELIGRAIDKGETEKVQKDIKVLKHHAIRIGKIAGSLLTFSREKSVKCSAVDLNEIVGQVIELIQYPIEKKGIELTLRTEPNLPLVWANSSGIEQVIYNIVYNAYQATEPGQTISISSRTEADGRIALEVSDTGLGIPNNELEHIFDPFFTTKEVGDGTGLGLSLSYGLINDFGGSIDVESEPGKGTVFTIHLDGALTRLKREKNELIQSNA